MNWKTVAYLVGVERKSGRLLRGQRLLRYTESKVSAYLFYFLALGLGVLVGFLAGYFVGAVEADPTLAGMLQPMVSSVFLSLPTIILLSSLVFTMLNQIQRSGIKAASQAPYWLPITWQEHTLASILANLLGFPLLIIIAIASGAIVFAAFTGFLVLAVESSLAMLAAAVMASATTEILRVLQVRFIGAVYKSTGRAAIWVRFAGSVAFFLIVYIVYFSVIYGTGAVSFIQAIASSQTAAWYVPFVWLGIMLYWLANGSVLVGFVFMALSLLFIAGLFYLGVWLNGRYGLYEPPAITVTRGGTYAPKTGLLGRLGFSTSEAALIRKDLKAFTRRRELMGIFIGPIVIVLVPLLQSVGTASSTSPPGFDLSFLWVALTFLMPASIMTLGLGSLIIGEEGQAVWRIFASPFSARSLVKSKYFFIILFSLIILAITGTVGTLIYHLSLQVAVIATLETLFLIFALGVVSLSSGIKGADFNELPRPRMIRVEWSILNLILCGVVGLVVLAPIGFYVFSGAVSTFIPGFPTIDPIIAVAASGVIAAIFTFIFYRVSVGYAEELLRKAGK
jgi:hypothetical protein